MSIPTYEEFMFPILRLAADRADHTFASALDNVVAHLGLTKEERAELLPSGQTRAYNRFCWAISYLQKAKLLERPARGRFRISERGLDVLKKKPNRIDNQLLEQFEEFREFKNRKRTDSVPARTPVVPDSAQTPTERFEEAEQELREAVAAELLDRMLRCKPDFFEKLVIDLLVAMGYGGSWSDAAQIRGKPGDGGIDGTIKEDKLGLDMIYVQAKRWEGSVGRKEVQSFAGSLEGERANKGVFLTTSTFTDEAREYVRKIGKKIILIDGKQLADLMIEHGVGIAVERTYTIKRVDSDYFEGID